MAALSWGIISPPSLLAKWSGAVLRPEAKPNKPSCVFQGAGGGYLMMPEVRLGRIHLTLMVLLEMYFLLGPTIKCRHTGCRGAADASGCFAF